jgi:hypothetical protein
VGQLASSSSARRRSGLGRRTPPGFIPPCLPFPAERPPTGPGWIHEIKHDGFQTDGPLSGQKEGGGHGVTITPPLKFVYDDGGREASGVNTEADDLFGCVCRAITIASQRPYREVFDDLRKIGWFPGVARKDASGQLHPHLEDEAERIEKYLGERGWTWVQTKWPGQPGPPLCIGTLPGGRLIVRVSHHLAAVIDGELHDINSPSASTCGMPAARASSSTSRASRTIRSRRRPTEPRSSVGRGGRHAAPGRSRD